MESYTPVVVVAILGFILIGVGILIDRWPTKKP